MIIQQLIQYLMMLIDMHRELTILYLILAKILFAVFLIPASPLTLLTGALLGDLQGFLVSMVGNTIGAMLAFLISRYLFKDLVEKKFLPKYPKIREYDELLFAKGLKTLLFLRLVPLFPFNVLNYLLGVTRITFKDYFLGTFLGIIPGTFAYVYLGRSLIEFSVFNIILAVLAILVLVYIGKAWKIKK